MTSELFGRIEVSLKCFPELESHQIKVGLVMNPKIHGNADGRDMIIRLNPRSKSGTSYFTMAHELTHLLQKPGLGMVPNGEIQCDIYALARHPLFTDDMPTYIRGLRCNKRSWRRHSMAVRELCIRAIEVRKTRRTYIAWLSTALEEYFAEGENSVRDRVGTR